MFSFTFKTNFLFSYDVRFSSFQVSYYILCDGKCDFCSESRQTILSRILNIMNEFQRKTCIKFVPVDLLRHKDFISFTLGRKCTALKGRWGGKQEVLETCVCRNLGFGELHRKCAFRFQQWHIYQSHSEWDLEEKLIKISFCVRA